MILSLQELRIFSFTISGITVTFRDPGKKVNEGNSISLKMSTNLGEFFDHQSKLISSTIDVDNKNILLGVS